MMHTLVFPYLNFALFLWLLYYVVRKPSRSYAQKKREEFESLRLKAQQAQANAHDKMQQLEQRQSQLQAEISRLCKAVEQQNIKEMESLQEKSKNLLEHLAGESERITKQRIESSAKELQNKIWEQGVKLFKQKLEGFDTEKHTAIISGQINYLERFAKAKELSKGDEPLRKEL